ncbi:MAG: valine--tRNA ligase, partial [Candidatus Cloacimonetes bacterium]|nr:valine--tRNA ligase [Candidatus Cloacimonadota bacterium]
MIEIPKRPNFDAYEPRIYQMWEKAGYFIPRPPLAARDKLPKKRPFTIIMPPPNANAPLHIGHALFVTIEDILIRYHRMLGEESLWLPGADHAGILTQVVFERKLESEGKTRYDLGREKFFAECMKFTLKNKKIMENQLRALGASCDWTRNFFTLDAKFDSLIYETFKKLYDDGLIYRGKRMINWCPRCQTALSDLEVEHSERIAKLYSIRYPLKLKTENSKLKTDYITVATTRPETMLGDTAVAVNPKDKRYKNLIGKVVNLPLVDREIPIIADERVDPKFGTGAVKITPAHDPTDFEIGQEHKLESVQVIGFDDRMSSEAGHYAGLPKLEARSKILNDLRKFNLLEKEEDYTHSVGHCERCKKKVEPLISMQWFVDTSSKFKVQSSKLKKLLRVSKASLADIGILAVKRGHIKIVPKRFEKIYFQWMENIHDWCISRQIWWGHQLPVWYCLSCSKVKPIVAINKPEKCPNCGSTNLYRDPDTLDTWFSSGQWPFNTLLSSQYKRDFDYFYPTSVMETGYEILFFWVARMIMLGLYATGEVPFRTVYLHGLVRDAFGEKMSKSKGNVIDPMDSVKKYGADALRMALILGNAPGTDSSLSEEKIQGMRNFVTKLWNIGRFVLAHEAKLKTQNSRLRRPALRRRLRQGEGFGGQAKLKTTTKNLKSEDKKIIKDLNRLIKRTTSLLDEYRFDLAAEELYHFIWHRFADEYVESVKPRLSLSKDLTLK